MRDRKSEQYIRQAEQASRDIASMPQWMQRNLTPPRVEVRTATTEAGRRMVQREGLNWTEDVVEIEEQARAPDIQLRRTVRDVADQLGSGEVVPADAARLLYDALNGDLGAEFEAVRAAHGP